MKVSLVFLISIFLLTQIQNQKIPFNKVDKPKFNTERLKSWKTNESALYHSSQTGDKTKVSPVLKKALKQFGLIHLLTPSGIHLSSLLLFIFLFLKRKFHKYIYFSLLFLFMPLTGFYSLKRILIFHILKSCKLSNQSSFIFTFIIDILIGGYLNSPLSFAFSFLCWGVIIFTNGSKLKLVYNLFLSQLIISYFSNFPINPISILINPLFTSIFSFLFPVMSINFWFFNENPVDSTIIYFFNFFKSILIFLSLKTSSLLFIPTASMLLIPIFHKFKIKNLIYLLVLTPTSLNLIPLSKSSKHSEVIIPLAHSSERLSSRKRKLNYWDRNCNLKYKGEFIHVFCKKKPSKNGGLSI
jgi:competence protein ComEC